MASPTLDELMRQHGEPAAAQSLADLMAQHGAEAAPETPRTVSSGLDALIAQHGAAPQATPGPQAENPYGEQERALAATEARLVPGVLSSGALERMPPTVTQAPNPQEQAERVNRAHGIGAQQRALYKASMASLAEAERTGALPPEEIQKSRAALLAAPSGAEASDPVTPALHAAGGFLAKKVLPPVMWLADKLDPDVLRIGLTGEAEPHESRVKAQETVGRWFGMKPGEASSYRESASPLVAGVLADVAWDIATNPLTYASMGASGAATFAKQAGKALAKAGLDQSQIRALTPTVLKFFEEHGGTLGFGGRAKGFVQDLVAPAPAAESPILPRSGAGTMTGTLPVKLPSGGTMLGREGGPMANLPGLGVRSLEHGTATDPAFGPYFKQQTKVGPRIPSSEELASYYPGRKAPPLLGVSNVRGPASVSDLSAHAPPVPEMQLPAAEVPVQQTFEIPGTRPTIGPSPVPTAAQTARAAAGAELERQGGLAGRHLGSPGLGVFGQEVIPSRFVGAPYEQARIALARLAGGTGRLLKTGGNFGEGAQAGAQAATHALAPGVEETNRAARMGLAQARNETQGDIADLAKSWAGRTSAQRSARVLAGDPAAGGGAVGAPPSPAVVATQGVFAKRRQQMLNEGLDVGNQVNPDTGEFWPRRMAADIEEPRYAEPMRRAPGTGAGGGGLNIPRAKDLAEQKPIAQAVREGIPVETDPALLGANYSMTATRAAHEASVRRQLTNAYGISRDEIARELGRQPNFQDLKNFTETEKWNAAAGRMEPAFVPNAFVNEVDRAYQQALKHPWQRALEKYTGALREAYTVGQFGAGYQLRNLGGDLMNGVHAGVDPKYATEVLRLAPEFTPIKGTPNLARTVLVMPSGTTISGGQMLADARRAGIIGAESSGFADATTTIKQRFRAHGLDVPRSGSEIARATIAGPLAGVGRSAAETEQDLLRLHVFMWRRGLGDSVEQAATNTFKMGMYDYGDRPRWLEALRMGTLFPVWLSKQAALTGRQIAGAPGRFAGPYQAVSLWNQAIERREGPAPRPTEQQGTQTALARLPRGLAERIAPDLPQASGLSASIEVPGVQATAPMRLNVPGMGQVPVPGLGNLAQQAHPAIQAIVGAATGRDLSGMPLTRSEGPPPIRGLAPAGTLPQSMSKYESAPHELPVSALAERLLTPWPFEAARILTGARTDRFRRITPEEERRRQVWTINRVNPWRLQEVDPMAAQQEQLSAPNAQGLIRSKALERAERRVAARAR